MPELNVPANYKVCSKRLVPECVQLGPPNLFKNNRICKNCQREYMKLYYVQHQDNLIERAKARSKRTYIKRRPTVELVEEVINVPDQNE